MSTKSKASEKYTVRGTMWVSSHTKKEDFSEEKDLEVQVFDVEPAWVEASYGLTINLGNYESARCDAGVKMPSYVEEIPETFEKAWELAKRQIEEQTKGIK